MIQCVSTGRFVANLSAAILGINVYAPDIVYHVMPDNRALFYDHGNGTYSEVNTLLKVTEKVSVKTMTEFLSELRIDKDIHLSKTHKPYDLICEALKDAYNNPFITVKYDAKEYDDYEYYTRIKFCAFKVDLNGGYYLMDSLGKITQQPSDWEYRIIARKEIVTKVNKVEKVVLSENKVFRTKEVISPKQEYYLFYKENEGLSDFKVIKTYTKN